MKNNNAVKLSIVLTSLFISMEASAAVWLPSITTFADCDPGTSSIGQSPSTYKTCGTAGGTFAESQASYTQVKTQVQVAADGVNGDYFASVTISDRVNINPVDSALLGQQGIFTFEFRMDGVLNGDTESVMYARTYEWYAPGNSWSGSWAMYRGGLETGTAFGDPGYTGPNVVNNKIVTVDMPFIFGEDLNYSISQTVKAFEAGSSADFFNTTSLIGVLATDSSGTAIDVNLTSGSGVDLVAEASANLAAVPIPAAVWLLGSGLIGLFGVAKRKARI